MVALLVAILLGIGSGAFSLFLDSCMGERMIFRRYRVWLERLAVRNKHLAYWLKPLGLCVYCFSEWVFIGLFLLVVSQIAPILPEIIVLFCVGSGFSYLIVDLWTRKH